MSHSKIFGVKLLLKPVFRVQSGLSVTRGWDAVDMSVLIVQVAGGQMKNDSANWLDIFV